MTGRGLWACGVVSALLSGCGGAPPSSISGTATYQGATIENGAIRFYPATKETGRGAIAAIKNGKYDIPVEKGLLAGPYTVTITADRLSGPNISGIPKVRGGAGGAAEPTEYIPPEYNDQTKLDVVVEPGANQKDFALPTK
ncbi:MAG: hypothetical protein QM811_30575 [Pirellulales bacterium]